jgi:hypothetical protein
LDAYLAKNAAEREQLKKQKGGAHEIHSYSLEEYGLDEKMVSSVFADYISEYKLQEVKKDKKA